MRGSRSTAAPKPERTGVLAVLQEQPMADRVQGLMHELQLEDELVISETLDAALRRIRSDYTPRVLLLDLADSAASFAGSTRRERSAAPSTAISSTEASGPRRRQLRRSRLEWTRRAGQRRPLSRGYDLRSRQVDGERPRRQRYNDR